MASADPPDDIIRRVVALLDASGVPYMLTGSFASSLHGAPRATQDIDIVIAPDRNSLRSLLSKFSDDEYYVSREAAFASERDAGLFNVLHYQSGWKIDFIMRKPRAFSLAEFERRVETQVLGITLQVASAEDVLIAKLEWAKLSGSERQIDDAAGIILTQGPDLDTAYVERWVKALGLDAEWTGAKQKATGSVPNSG